MKGKSKKFDYLSEIYGHFTEKNKEKLIKTATRLLKVQKEDAKILVDAPPLPMEAEKEGLG